jgi:hypothetical protein
LVPIINPPFADNSPQKTPTHSIVSVPLQDIC